MHPRRSPSAMLLALTMTMPLAIFTRCAAPAPDAPPRFEIVEEELDGPLAALEGGYLVRPDVAGRRPVVVLSHGRRDLAADLRGLAQRLAGRGYVVLLRRPSTGLKRPDEIGGLEADLAAMLETTWVEADRVGLVGFCGGGYQSLLFASRTEHDLAAVVAFYGPLDFPAHFQPEGGEPFVDLFEVVDRIAAPVQGHYGNRDEIIPADDARRLEQRLREAGREADVFVYEAAEHGFCDHTHGHYDEDSCDLAVRRTLAFLDEQLQRS